MKKDSLNRKLLLFDIDGTLISSGGRGRKAMVAATQDEFQQEIEFEFLPFAGMTDRFIVAQFIEKNGLFTSDIESTIDRILKRYVEHLKLLMVSENTVQVLPGVLKLLKTVSQMEEFSVGLVTGNIEAGARLKLAPAKLNDYFRFGAFGDDNANRNLLPPIAVQRAEALYQATFEPKNVWIIGDTPKDIECAKVNGYRSLAVATGGWAVEKLNAHHPDFVLENLSEGSQVVSIFSTLDILPNKL
mgnify:CR=1 FL=1